MRIYSPSDCRWCVSIKFEVPTMFSPTKTSATMDDFTSRRGVTSERLSVRNLTLLDGLTVRN